MENCEYPAEHPRDLLANAIIASLQSWPELQRRIFVEVHYCGKAAQDVADLLGLPVAEVIDKLEQCELKLYRALKDLRYMVPPEIPAISPSRQADTSGCCFH